MKTLGDAALLRVLPGEELVKVLGPGKPLALVVYLSCSAGCSAAREHLIDLLWSNLDLDGARQGLRQTLWYLRRRLGPDAVVTRDQEVALTACVDSDRDRFLEAMDRRDFERAIELYQGEFMPMFAAPGGADFETWGDMERFRLRTYFLGAAEAVAWKRMEQGNLEGAKAEAVRARDIHPLAQSAWRLLLEILLAANDPLTARIEGEALGRQLEAEKRIPSPATQKVLDAVRDSLGHTSDETTGSFLCPEFIGRERGLAQILAAWRLAKAGRGRHIHVRGPPGFGKTRLVKEVTRRLSSMEAQVVQIRAAPGRREVSYALVSQMAGELAKLPGAEGISQGAASVLTALNPGLTDHLSTPPMAARGDEVLRQRDLAMAELVAATSLHQPLALFVDDVHRADDRSQELLHTLSERVPGYRLLLVTTARTTGREAPKSCTELVSLEPLSTDNVTTLLASLGALPQGEWAEEFPHRLCDLAGGSPLLILETLRLALERGLLALEGGGWVCTDHERLEAELARGGALRWRVEELSEEGRQLLLPLCIAGVPINLHSLARVVRRGPDEVASELQAMEVGGLVKVEENAWVPAHDRIGTAVLDGAEPEELALAHRRLGRDLAEEAAGVEGGPEADLLLRSCRHLLAAGEWSELGRVCDSWIRSVRRRGDRRSLRALAREVIGGVNDSVAARRVIRSLPLVTRLGVFATGPRRLVLTGGALGVMFLALFQMAAPASAPPDAVLIMLQPGAGGEVTAYELPIRREGWEELETIDVSAAGRLIPELTGLPIHSGHVLQMPGQRRWAYAGAVEESWGPDLFLVGPSGAPERVTRMPGDDVPLSWSPDGRSLLFQTGRWNPNYWQDVAILDLETAEVRPLTRSDDHSHSAARWSPDGTRVLFDRYRIVAELGEADPLGHDPREMCWIRAGAEGERCLDLPLESVVSVGWVDTEWVLVQAVDNAGTSGLYQVRLEDAEVRMLHRGVLHAQVSPDGRWLAILRERPAPDGPEWLVYPMGHPELAVPLAGVDGLPTWFIRWGHAGHVERHLDHLDVLCPDSVQVGVPTRLRAGGLDPRGNPVPLHVLSWEVDDTVVAILDGDTDVLLPRVPGVIEVRVSAGGWREATRQVTVVPSAHQMLWTEGWDRGLEERWVPFGDPRPSVTEWPAGGWAFWNRGDGFHGSGVYSRQEVPWSRSPGVEAEVSIPRTGLRAQRVSVGFRTWIEPEAVEAWDHRTGNLMGDPHCEMVYPAGDGAEQVAWAWMPDQRVAMDPALASGEPFTVRIQIFPDGSCGLAVNGEPLFRGDLRSREETSDRVVLMGESLNTRVLVGQVEVWEGVRDGVDWSVLAWDAASARWLTPDRGD